MKATFFVTILLVGLAGLATAAPPGPPNDAAFELDLTALDMGKYFLKCANNGKDLRACQSPTLWQETNDYGGLQSTVLVSWKIFKPDTELTP